MSITHEALKGGQPPRQERTLCKQPFPGRRKPALLSTIHKAGRATETLLGDCTARLFDVFLLPGQEIKTEIAARRVEATPEVAATLLRTDTRQTWRGWQGWLLPECPAGRKNLRGGPSMSDSTQLEFGFRTAKGEWRPPYPVKIAPLFVWPPRPTEALKWLLGYGGSLLPWNIFYMGLATVTWLWIQPSLARCAELGAGWISEMYLRNLIFLWIVTGGWHLLFYTLKLEGMSRKYDPH